MTEESPGSSMPSEIISRADQQQKDHAVKQIERRLGELAQSELERETTMSAEQAASPAKENIYTEQIGQLINATDEILVHVDVIEKRISVMLGPSSIEKADASLPDVPPDSPTILSQCLAELASHIALLGERVIHLETRIIS